MTQICHITRHTPPTINNRLSTFVRCVQLARRKLQVGQIAFLLRRSKGLIQQYLDLPAACDQNRNMAYHLKETIRLGTTGGLLRSYYQKVD